MIDVSLTRSDEHLAQTLCDDTMEIVFKFGYQPRNEKMGSLDRRQATLQGFRTELAVARLFDLETPRFNVKSDSGIDLWLGNCSIDVKCTFRQEPDLIFDNEDKFKSDVAVLCQVFEDNNIIRIWGYVSKVEFSRRAIHKNFGYGDRLVVPANQLDAIEKLWKKYKQKTLKETHHV